MWWLFLLASPVWAALSAEEYCHHHHLTCPYVRQTVSHRLAYIENHSTTANYQLGLTSRLHHRIPEGRLSSRYRGGGGIVLDVASKGEAGSLDWRPYLGPVDDQGDCASCWAYAVVAALQVCHRRSISFGAVQQLVDCSTEGNRGCSGGLPVQTYKYLLRQGLGEGTTCPTTPATKPLTGYQEVTPNDPAALLAAVRINPVVVCIEAYQPVFQLYTGGILDTLECGTHYDHAVLIVGYGTAETPTGSLDYWLIRNSWGTSWGEEGYARIKRVGGAGICGINQLASYPTC